MLTAEYSAGFGDAKPPLSLGTDFNCDPADGRKVCYGIGDTHEKFMAFQRHLNTYPVVKDGSLGFKSLTVNGFIDQKTADAAAAVIQSLGLNDTVSSKVVSERDYHTVAAWTPTLIYNMALSASLPRDLPTVKTSEEYQKYATATGSDEPVYKKTWFWGVIGGVAVLGIGAAVLTRK